MSICKYLGDINDDYVHVQLIYVNMNNNHVDLNDNNVLHTVHIDLIHIDSLYHKLPPHKVIKVHVDINSNVHKRQLNCQVNLKRQTNIKIFHLQLEC